jgi:hypothetical protein
MPLAIAVGSDFQAPLLPQLLRALTAIEGTMAMQFISFEMNVNRVVENAYLEWRRSIPKKPGELLLFADVVATPVGSKMRCNYPEGFLQYLKMNKIPFEIE